MPIGKENPQNRPAAGRGKRPLSWRTSVFGLITAALLMLILFMIVSTTNLYRQTQTALEEADSQTLTVATENLQNKLELTTIQIKDLLRTVHDEENLDNPLDFYRIAAQNAVSNDIASKLSFSNDISAMFVCNTRSGSIICDYNPRIGNAVNTVTALRSHLKAEEPSSSVLSDNTWSLMVMDRVPVFYKAYRYGHYVVGAVCQMDHYMSVMTGGLDENTGVAFVRNDGLVVYQGGRDWQNQVDYSSQEQTTYRTGQLVVSVCPMDNADGRILMISQENVLSTAFLSSAITVIAMPILCILFVLMVSALLRRRVVKPTDELLRATERIEAGDYDYRVETIPDSLEFRALTENFNRMTGEIVNLKIADYEHRISVKENELQMLRAQIRPHFYVNAVTTLVNMTYQNRNEDLRQYLWALADYMRYMLKIRSQTVRVSEELDNVRSYLKMQEIKFPNSIRAEIECQEEAENLYLPYLVLFTIVENTIKHAMNLYETLEIRIRCVTCPAGEEMPFNGLRITVEDSGAGFPQEVLDRYRAGVPFVEDQNETHIGLSNVRRTLQLMYNRDDLLILSNREPQGARVEIRIPTNREEL